MRAREHVETDAKGAGQDFPPSGNQLHATHQTRAKTQHAWADREVDQAGSHGTRRGPFRDKEGFLGLQKICPTKFAMPMRRKGSLRTKPFFRERRGEVTIVAARVAPKTQPPCPWAVPDIPGSRHGRRDAIRIGRRQPSVPPARPGRGGQCRVQLAPHGSGLCPHGQAAVGPFVGFRLGRPNSRAARVTRGVGRSPCCSAAGQAGRVGCDGRLGQT